MPRTIKYIPPEELSDEKRKTRRRYYARKVEKGTAGDVERKWLAEDAELSQREQSEPEPEPAKPAEPAPVSGPTIEQTAPEPQAPPAAQPTDPFAPRDAGIGRTQAVPPPPNDGPKNETTGGQTRAAPSAIPFGQGQPPPSWRREVSEKVGPFLIALNEQWKARDGFVSVPTYAHLETLPGAIERYLWRRFPEGNITDEDIDRAIIFAVVSTFGLAGLINAYVWLQEYLAARAVAREQAEVKERERRAHESAERKRAESESERAGKPEPEPEPEPVARPQSAEQRIVKHRGFAAA